MITPWEKQFIIESNRIEGIHRDPTDAEIEEFLRFMAQDEITVKDLKKFISVYQPNAKLRNKQGMNVHIGGGGKIIYVPPRGGKHILESLKDIVDTTNIGRGNPAMAYTTHHAYESLHPFTDGNGRSGRMLWAWMMGDVPSIGFLHCWYYQSLQYSRKS